MAGLKNFMQYMKYKMDLSKNHTNQREMEIAEKDLEKCMAYMYENEQMVIKEHSYPAYDEGAEEARETIMNEDGVFQKINYRSKIYEGQVYNMLYKDNQFISMTVEDDKIKDLVVKSKGVYRKANVNDMLPEKSKANINNLYAIIEMMSDMAVLVEQDEIAE